MLIDLNPCPLVMPLAMPPRFSYFKSNLQHVTWWQGPSQKMPLGQLGP